MDDNTSSSNTANLTGETQLMIKDNGRHQLRIWKWNAEETEVEIEWHDTLDESGPIYCG